jgi:hypothetical protein
MMAATSAATGLKVVDAPKAETVVADPKAVDALKVATTAVAGPKAVDAPKVAVTAVAGEARASTVRRS